MESSDFRQTLERRTKELELVIYSYLPKEEGLQKTVISAMNYSVQAGGKRLRPMLMEETFRMCGGDRESRMLPPFLAAIEMIHTYSLVHDDLPAMDNDDFRRGKPSCHKKFGEDVAILTGDALLTHAFSCLSDNVSDFQVTIRQISDLARYSGLEGMIKGQLLDIKAHELNPDVFTIQDNKTSGLFK